MQRANTWKRDWIPKHTCNNLGDELMRGTVQSLILTVLHPNKFAPCHKSDLLVRNGFDLMLSFWCYWMQSPPVWCLPRWRWTANTNQSQDWRIDRQHLLRLCNQHIESTKPPNIHMEFSNQTGTLFRNKTKKKFSTRFGFYSFYDQIQTMPGKTGKMNRPPYQECNIWRGSTASPIGEVMHLWCKNRSIKLYWKVQFF